MSGLKKIESLTRNVWLAGLGAYGRSVEEIGKVIDERYEQSSQVFNGLVAKGSEVESELTAKLDITHNFEERVDQVRTKLGLDESDKLKQLTVLEKQIDSLVDIVAELVKQRENASDATVTPQTEDVTDTSVEAKAEETETSASANSSVTAEKKTTRRSTTVKSTRGRRSSTTRKTTTDV